MSQTAIRKERLWQVEARITLPRFMQKGKDGSLPSPLTLFNIYPEQVLDQKDGFEVWLKCDSPESIVSIHDFLPGTLAATQIVTGHEDKIGQDLGYLHPERHPYKLVAKVRSDKPEKAIDTIIERIDLLTDILSFQLQYPVKIIKLRVFDISEELHKGDKCELIEFSGTPFYRVAKDAGALYNDPVTLEIYPNQISKDLPEDIEAGLRWFTKGISAFPVVDKFTFYWIALEKLVPHIIPSEERKHFRCQKCNYELQKCPECGAKWPKRPRPLSQKIKLLVMSLGRKSELFDQLWETRQLFHGRIKLKDFQEISHIARLVSELKSIVVDALKIVLDLSVAEPPYSPISGFQWSTMGIHGFIEKK